MTKALSRIAPPLTRRAAVGWTSKSRFLRHVEEQLNCFNPRKRAVIANCASHDMNPNRETQSKRRFHLHTSHKVTFQAPNSAFRLPPLWHSLSRVALPASVQCACDQSRAQNIEISAKICLLSITSF